MAELASIAAVVTSCAVVFAAADGGDVKLYRSNGLAGGTIAFKDLPAKYPQSFPFYFRDTANGVVFSNEDVASGRELWVTSGTDAGTKLLKDINYGVQYSSFPGSNTGTARTGLFQKVGSRVIFAATKYELGREIWVSDGTAKGTHLLFDHLPGNGSSVDNRRGPGEFVFSNGKFAIYTVLDRVKGRSLFASDGTAAGTRFISDWNNTYWGAIPKSFGYLGADKLLFTKGNLHQLWVTDGTLAGTKLLKDFGKVTYSVDVISRLPGKPYALFSATQSATGYELWITDGTAAGTKLLKNINLHEHDSAPAQFVEVGSDVYFAATDDSGGRELWKTRGTAATTKRVADLVKGVGSSYPSYLSRLGNKLVFAATILENGSTATRPFISDGTAAGTKKLSEFVSVLGPFANLGSRLVFIGNENTNGAINLYSTNASLNGQQRLTSLRNWTSFPIHRVSLAVGGTGTACPN